MGEVAVFNVGRWALDEFPVVNRAVGVSKDL
jgi:hypothetical protein